MSLASAARVLGFASILIFAQVIAGENVSMKDVATLMRIANGDDPAERLSATRELFRRGPAALPELAAAGARPMANISPSRSDVIYTLIRGLSGAEARSEFLGLHLDPSATADDLRRMGARHGFRLDSDMPFDTNGAPTCYVRLMQGKDVAVVMHELLTSESAVKSINFNYSERSGKP
jgi:hypothetical protein